MTKREQNMSDGNSHLGVMEHACDLRFRRRRDNMPEGSALNEDGSRGGGAGWGGCAEGKITGDAAAGFWRNEVGGIGVYSEEHVIGVETKGGCGVCGRIVKETVAQL